MTSGLEKFKIKDWKNLRFTLQLGDKYNSNNDRLFLNSTGRYHSVNGILLIPSGRRRQTPNPNFLFCLRELMKEEIDYVTPTLQGNKQRFRRDIIPRLKFRVRVDSIDHRYFIRNLRDLKELLNAIQICGFVYRFVIEAYHPDLLLIPLNCSNLDSVAFAFPIRQQQHAPPPLIAVPIRRLLQQQQHYGGENHQNNNSSPTPPPLITSDTSNTTIRVSNVSPPPAPTTKYCIICMENPVNHVIIPCGHLSLCENCSSNQNLNRMRHQCPDCRTTIERTMKVYGGRICQ